MKHKTEITLEVTETVVVRLGERVRMGSCPDCRKVTLMSTPGVVAALTARSEREVFRFIEAGLVHFSEEERVYACLGCFLRLQAPDGSVLPPAIFEIDERRVDEERHQQAR